MTVRFTPLTCWVTWRWLGPRTTDPIKRKCLEMFGAQWAFQIGCVSVWGHQ